MLPEDAQDVLIVIEERLEARASKGKLLGAEGGEGGEGGRRGGAGGGGEEAREVEVGGGEVSGVVVCEETGERGL